MPTKAEKRAGIMANYGVNVAVADGESPDLEAQTRADIVNKHVTNVQNQPSFSSGEPEKQGFVETALGAAGALGQGGTLGFADEIGSGLYAAGRSALTDETFGDVYDRAMGYNKENREEFFDENPVSSVALNIAGALPMALKTAPILAQKGATMLPHVLKTSPYARSLLGYTGLGAVEGGVYGMGAADTFEEGVENLPENMLTSAAFGAGGKVAGDALGAGYNALTRRRLAQELGKGDEFIPIGEAVGDENSWLKGYASNLEKVWGSKIPEQKAKLLQRIRPTLSNAVKKAERGSQLAKEQAAAFKQRVGTGTTNKYRKGVTQLEDIADAGKRAELEGFQKKAIRAAEPDILSEEAEKALLTANPQQAAEILRGEWVDGFKVVKGRKFHLSPAKITKDAMKEIDVRGLDDYSAGILDTLETKLKSSGTGWLAGADLMEARNTFRVAINEMKDKGASAQQREAFSRVASSIDDAIESQLDPVARKVFREELTAWGNYQTMRGAAGRAAARKQGYFEPSDWISEKKLAQGRRVQEGTAPLQPEAMQAQVNIEGLESNLASGKKGLDLAKEATTKQAQLARKPALGPEQMGMGYNAAKEAVDSLGPVPNIGNIFTQRAYSSAVPAPEQLGMGAKLLGGVGIGRIGTAQSTQRALAGQTAWQGGARKLAEITPTQAITDALRRTALLNQEQ